VKAVVAAARLLAEPLLPIDADRVHGSPPLGSVEFIHHGGTEARRTRRNEKVADRFYILCDLRASVVNFSSSHIAPDSAASGGPVN
jgi:hypothetical protein